MRSYGGFQNIHQVVKDFQKWMLRNTIFNSLPPKFQKSCDFSNNFLPNLSRKVFGSNERMAIPEKIKKRYDFKSMEFD